jgi:hypothetical protein
MLAIVFWYRDMVFLVDDGLITVYPFSHTSPLVRPSMNVVRLHYYLTRLAFAYRSRLLRFSFANRGSRDTNYLSSAAASKRQHVSRDALDGAPSVIGALPREGRTSRQMVQTLHCSRTRRCANILRGMGRTRQQS